MVKLSTLGIAAVAIVSSVVLGCTVWVWVDVRNSQLQRLYKAGL